MKKTQYNTDQNNPAIQAYVEAVEKGKRNQHIFPRGDGWIVKKLLSEKASETFSTQKEALQYAESNASHGTAVFIHGLDGLIMKRKDY